MRRFLSVTMAGMLFGVVGGALAPAAAHATMIPRGCAPGSFDDTDGVVAKIDATANKEMKRAEHTVDMAKLQPGGSIVKVKTLSNGVLQRTTLTRSVDGNTYDWELAMAQPSATPSYVVISTASRTDEGVVGTVHTVDKAITDDYTARGTFVPTKATGNFSATIVRTNDTAQPAPGNKVTLNVTFTGISIRPNDPHGARTGSYTHIGEPTIGGSLDFHASIPDPCPGTTMGPVDILVQRRHVDDVTGERTFRRDALVTGGSLPAGGASITFVCGTNTPSGTKIIRATYKLHKIENPDGSTKSFTVTLHNETAPNCNPDFGAQVSPDNNSTDSPFAHPVTFPGVW